MYDLIVVFALFSGATQPSLLKVENQRFLSAELCEQAATEIHKMRFDVIDGSTKTILVVRTACLDKVPTVENLR